MSLTNVIIWLVDISLDSVVYRVVLGVYMKDDFPLVYYIVNKYNRGNLYFSLKYIVFKPCLQAL